MRGAVSGNWAYEIALFIKKDQAGIAGDLHCASKIMLTVTAFTGRIKMRVGKGMLSVFDHFGTFGIKFYGVIILVDVIGNIFI